MAAALTVVVPTRGRPAALRRCVASLLAQRLPDDAALDVIVVDDGSVPPVTLDPPPPGAPPVRVIRQENQGPAAARNAGLRAATGALVAFIDDDCEATPSWAASLLAAAARHPGSGRGGRVVNALAANRCAEASQLLVSFLCEYYARQEGGARFFTSNNLAFPREALVAADGFDARYQRAAGEDRELCDRWVDGGRRLVAVPDAVVLHAHDLTVATFCRQHFTYGRGAWGFRRARAYRSGAPVRVEPWTFYRDLLWHPVQTHGWRGLPLCGLLVMAQTANVLGFLAEARRRT
jgi:glycosyltransferase involved in cell wall biosynthesis